MVLYIRHDILDCFEGLAFPPIWSQKLCKLFVILTTTNGWKLLQKKEALYTLNIYTGYLINSQWSIRVVNLPYSTNIREGIFRIRLEKKSQRLWVTEVCV
jgi:hypothetical protein